MAQVLSQSVQPVDKTLLEEVILPQVTKPARYLGLEQGAYRKPFGRAKATMAFVFPDLYEIGVSNYGMKLFYSLVNQHKDYLCDRAYAPAPDMREKLAEYAVPLYGLESLIPLRDFDMLAFTLQYELNNTSVLGVMESAQIPLRAADRDDNYPLIIAGGPGSANPMPMAPFFDAFIIGDGEEVLIEILDVLAAARKTGRSKQQVLDELAGVEGIYIPGKTEKADKRIIDIAEHPVDIAPLIPVIEAVHDRVTIEARRGCDRMCRFCQPCFINLPVREQSIDQVKKQALKEIEKTGYEECSLLSLSIADYSYFKPLVLEVADALDELGVSLSLPSQRADRFSLDVAEAVQSVRKSTLTFAPEAGTQRLRDVINKNLSDAEIVNAVTTAYRSGWNKVKLYFIIGLPTETLDDLDGIVHIVKMLQSACRDIKRETALSIRKNLEVNVTLSNFVPKPHTPFQWFPQDTMDTLYGKIKYLKARFRELKGVKVNFTDPEISKLEAVISKGGPELADVLEAAYRKGAYLDAWDDINNFNRWFEALGEAGFDTEAYTRERCVDPADDLPWDVIDMGLNKSWLAGEYEKARAEAATVPCFEACSTCGVCANYGTWPKFTETPRDISKYERAKRQKDNSGKPVRNDNGLPEEVQAQIANRPAHMLKEPVCKLRLKVRKAGKLKFISHLDWLRMIHRVVQRAGLPVAYSQGFSPKPKISFGPALPLFSEGMAEYVDVYLSETVENAAARLNEFLPEDGRVLAEEILPTSAASIDQSVRAMTYVAHTHETGYAPGSSGQTTCNGPVKEYTITERVQTLQKALANRTALTVEVETSKGRNKRKWNGQTEPGQSRQIFDIAPFISDLKVHDDGSVSFRIYRRETGDGSKKAVKPVWVLRLIDPDGVCSWSLARTEIELEAEPVRRS